MPELRVYRSPWRDFPDVIVQTTIAKLKAHPDYPNAKAGNPEAGIRVVSDLLKPDKVTFQIDAYNLLPRGNPALIALHRVKDPPRPEIMRPFPAQLQAGGGQRAIPEETSKRCDFPRSMSRGQSVDACRGCLEARFTNRSAAS
jgi:hypothetical protein